MKFIADLHVHSAYSRATSSHSNLEGFHQWARIKGIDLVGTGDFTHPGWFAELKDKLDPEEDGFFRLKNPPAEPPAELPGVVARTAEVRFCLTSEISSIYKKNGATRKVHSVIFAPDFGTVARIIARLQTIGNLKSDGRPILGLDPKILLEIIKDASPDAHLIPAHIWTPWFSVFGSKSGFDTMEECFEDLTSEIFALETGLSSDPTMNWRLSALDRYSLISNSDAHSPQKLGREANVFDTEFGYRPMFEALRTGRGFHGTLEFYPEEGKYHFDGHRKCRTCLDPAETRTLGSICPKCGKPVTIGVMHRVIELADRERPSKPVNAPGFKYVIPLEEIIAELNGTGAAAKSVRSVYSRIISEYGSEFSFLLDTSTSEVSERLGPAFGEAVARMREGRVMPQPGYDGEFGVVRVFSDDELKELTGQGSLFAFDAPGKVNSRTRLGHGKNAVRAKKKGLNAGVQTSENAGNLDREQSLVLGHRSGSMLITAGPGTGKTRTVIAWITHLVESRTARPGEICAITFTNRACAEMRERLHTAMGNTVEGVFIATFHGFAFDLVREMHPKIVNVFDEKKRRSIVSFLFPDMNDKDAARLCVSIAGYFDETNETVDVETRGRMKTYIDGVKKLGGIDLAMLIPAANQLLKKEPGFLERIRDRYRYIAIDELQDINQGQYTLVSMLRPGVPEDVSAGIIVAEAAGMDAGQSNERRALIAIGDPDQAIYGFRGSRVELFFRFRDDRTCRTAALRMNYRSSGPIVRAAAALIAHNKRDSRTAPLPGSADGESIGVYGAADQHDEACFIADTVETRVGGTRFESGSVGDSDLSFADIAVLARTRAILESAGAVLLDRGIPLRIGKASSFINEEPFSHLINALALIENPGDVTALADFFIGFFDNITFSEIRSAIGKGMVLDTLPGFFKDDKSATLLETVEFISSLRASLPGNGIRGTIESLIKRYEFLAPEKSGRGAEMESFLDMADEYDYDLTRFLRRCSLDIHESESRFKADRVSLLTFHASKGLEFPLVIIAGAEEGSAPITRKESEIEEERRLFYVAMTRAKRSLIITWSGERQLFGKQIQKQPSRFIDEIRKAGRADEFITDVPKSKATGARRKKKNDGRQLLLFDGVE